MFERRRAERYDIAVPVMVTTVLETIPATISDLSEQGARLDGISLEHGARLQIDFEGQTLFAESRWSEVDRTGVLFLERLTQGPLFERLQSARQAAEAAARDRAAEQARALALGTVVHAEGMPFVRLRPCRCLNWHLCAEHGPQPGCMRLGDGPANRRDAA